MRRRVFAATACLLPFVRPASAGSDDAQTAASLATVAGFLHAVATSQPAQPFLATDLRNHAISEPSGARDFAAFCRQPAVAAAAARQRLFMIAEADRVMVAYAAGSDPPSGFAATLFEVRAARITQIWSSGHDTAAQPDAGAVLIPAGYADPRQRAAARDCVTAFVQNFFVRGDPAATQALSPQLRCHVPGVPSGTGFAVVARKHQDKVTAPDVQAPLFILAQGDLVAIGFPLPYAGDPGSRFAQNVARLQNGTITDWWYSGVPKPPI